MIENNNNNTKYKSVKAHLFSKAWEFNISSNCTNYYPTDMTNCAIF